MLKICHFTTAHEVDDIRIFIKECTSLAKKLDYQVYLVGRGKSERKNGVSIVGLEYNSKNRLDRMFNFSRKVYKEALKIDADVYHFHDPELLRYALKLKRLGKKVIYDSHEDVPKQILSKEWLPFSLRNIISKILEKYEKRVIKKIDITITASLIVTERFSRINDKNCTINNFALLTKDKEFNSDNFDKKRSIICYAGGLTKVRNIHNIVKAMDNVEGKLILAGPCDGSYKNYLEKLSGWEKTRYIGKVRRKQVDKLYYISYIGIFIYSAEPNHKNSFPNKLFEYMYAGIPVICSNFDHYKKIVEVNNCGLCVDPENVPEISKAINYLLENRNIAKQMGLNGHKVVVEKYNWNIEERKLMEVYKNLEN
ncbi:MAG: glycosyltransferase family 4 protein [Lactobacillales bacterium]|jgi:glycosyltransferase involved in cell wall biosynthesis|nr:glycosyltransferase family 4 protein [Lactobacillales bacterium]